MYNLLNTKFVGEENDTKVSFTMFNTVGITVLNDAELLPHFRTKMKKFIIFPDREKAEHFAKNYTGDNCLDYRDCMMKENYLFHIVMADKIDRTTYADQYRMSSEYPMHK